ncbi:MAG: PTS sugar transporter subunit IIA [Opitutaceae bacterium]|jgi:mannitol/fructose-specific phosphotransferase system IIA component (Ntr-type)
MRSILTALQDGRLFELPEGAGKERVLAFLARILDANPKIEAGTDVIEEINRREQECNTGIGLGVAVPHVRARQEEGELFCAIGWSSQGIDYGSPDGMPVHLAVMYYIPGAQKNVYLKEISTLVKAIRKSGGIEPIAKAPDLNAVRNLLLDWVSSVLSDSGPEAVARMIKLEVKQAQSPLGADVAHPPVRVGSKATAFSVLVAPPQGPFVLSADLDWSAALEKEEGLPLRLAGCGPFNGAGHQIYVTGLTQYPGGRILYQCVALTNGQPAAGAPASPPSQGA